MGLSSRTAIATYWNSKTARLRAPGLDLDIGEPACFACGWSSPHWQTKASAPWDGAGLERAHLVARADEGSDAVENLVLLCSVCHAEAPMTADPGAMLAWMVSRPSFFERRVHQLRMELERKNITTATLTLEASRLDRPLLRTTFDEVGAGMHFGKGMSMATAAVAMERYILARDRQQARCPRLRPGTADPLF